MSTQSLVTVNPAARHASAGPDASSATSAGVTGRRARRTRRAAAAHDRRRRWARAVRPRRSRATRSTRPFPATAPSRTARCASSRGRDRAPRTPDQVRERVADPGAADRDPTVGVLGDVREQLRSGRAADEDRWAARLHRLRPRPRRLDVDELAVVLGDVVAPERPHREHVLACSLAPRPHVDAVARGFVLVPPEADPEHEATARQHVERRDRLGRHDRVVLRDEADAGADDESLGRGGRHRRVRRRGRACACTPRATRRRRWAAACSDSSGCACARARRASTSPRASTARANSTMPMVWSVANIVTPNCTRVGYPAVLCGDRVVVVTGAGRGIGREHALAFARRGGQGRRQRPRRVARRQRLRRRPGAATSSTRSPRPAATRSPTPTTSPTGTAPPRSSHCDRHLRRPRRPREQRRVPPRPHDLHDERGGVGRGDPRPPQGTLRDRPATPPSTGGHSPRPVCRSTPASSTRRRARA